MRFTYLLAVSILVVVGCSENEDGGCRLNAFSLEDDVELGAQLRDELLSDTSDLEVLERTQYPEAYAYLDSMAGIILAQPAIQHPTEFAWEFYIVQDDSTLNAFAAPGGYIFFYTGLIKYLNKGSSFAGVLAHEIAHADLRHSTCQLSQNQRVGSLISIVTGGDPGAVAEITAALLGLQFSRSDEAEADEFSVRYLCTTDIVASGAADFFAMLEADGAGGAAPPEFLSTHPSSDSRVEDINASADAQMCTGPNLDSLRYAQFKASLP